MRFLHKNENGVKGEWNIFNITYLEYYSHTIRTSGGRVHLLACCFGISMTSILIVVNILLLLDKYTLTQSKNNILQQQQYNMRLN